VAQRELAAPAAKLTPCALDEADAGAVDELELSELQRDLLVSRGHRGLERARKPRSAGKVKLAAKDELDRRPIGPNWIAKSFFLAREGSYMPP